MKKLIIALAALMVSIAAYGQGQFNFNNRVGTEVTARFITSADPANGSSSSIGTPDWSVQLTGGAPGGALVTLDPATTTFRGAPGSTSAGYVTQISPIVPGVAPGLPAAIGVTVLGPGGLSQSFGPYTVNLGGGTITPPNLPLGVSPLVVNVVPEPATLALGALGLGALLAIRRRK